MNMTRRKSTPPLELAKNIDAALSRHADVEQQDIGPRRWNALDRLRAILGFADDLQFLIELQEPTDPLAHEKLIVGYEDANHGSTAMTAKPRPGSLTIFNSPPAASTRARMPRRPKPSGAAALPRPSSCARICTPLPLRSMAIQRFSAPEWRAALVTISCAHRRITWALDTPSRLST